MPDPEDHRRATLVAGDEARDGEPTSDDAAKPTLEGDRRKEMEAAKAKSGTLVAGDDARDDDVRAGTKKR